MPDTIIEDKDFNGVVFTAETFIKGNYENCNFVNCMLPKLDLSHIHFTECFFDNCDLSMAVLSNTALKGVQFENCKLLGLDFAYCEPFLLSLAFENCLLTMASFFQLKLKGTRFKNCNLQEVDFSGADLSQALFYDCEMAMAKFEHTNLEKADFRTAFNYSIDPEMNKIKGARFSLMGVVGLLDKYAIVVE